MVNSIWVHQNLRHTFDDGLHYLALFFGLVDSTKIQVIRGGEPLLRKAFEVASRNGTALYDSVFVALALQTGLPLRTLDEKQSKTMAKELER